MIIDSPGVYRNKHGQRVEILFNGTHYEEKGSDGLCIYTERGMRLQWNSAAERYFTDTDIKTDLVSLEYKLPLKIHLKDFEYIKKSLIPGSTRIKNRYEDYFTYVGFLTPSVIMLHSDYDGLFEMNLDEFKEQQYVVVDE